MSPLRPDPPTHLHDVPEDEKTSLVSNHAVTQSLTDRECLSRLGSASQGLLRYCSGRGPVALAVIYDFIGPGVVICVAGFNDASQYVPGCTVTLEVARQIDPDIRWVVGLSGTARRVPPTWQNRSRYRGQLSQWPSGIASTMLYIPAGHLWGFVEILVTRERLDASWGPLR